MSGAGKPPVEQTDVGSYFVANYPPFSAWKPQYVSHAHAALSERPVAEGDTSLKASTCTSRSAGSAATFCYFRVYTDKNARRGRQYLDLLAREWELYAAGPRSAGRTFNFVYFGGGTPSFLSTKQLQGLVGRLNATGAWNNAEEITFECEPGTITEAKLAAIRELGVTRLSLGVENFDDRILELNGRAHRSPEVGRAYEARARSTSRRSTST
jgi:oxygen-independent coproporphyrinogen-3 oxidase